MSKKLTWLDKFAEEQAQKIEKTASIKKIADQIIVDPDEVPDAVTGSNITYKDTTYKVVDAEYKDEIGSGIVLEKLAAMEDEKIDEEIPAEKCEVCNNEPCTCENEEVAPVEAPVVAPTEVPDPTGVPVAQNPTVPMNPAVGDNGIPGQKKVTDAPEMARTNPGDVYHIEVRDTVEVQKFESDANETAANIAAEDAIDGTTPAGKVNRILQRIQNPTAVVPVVEEVPVVEAPTEEISVELNKEEKPVEEVPAEETPVEEKEDEKAKLANNRIFKKIIAKLK